MRLSQAQVTLLDDLDCNGQLHVKAVHGKHSGVTVDSLVDRGLVRWKRKKGKPPYLLLTADGRAALDELDEA